MTILVIADDEGVIHTVPRVRADVLISCGDLPECVILTVAERVGSPPILAVKGNHDSAAPFDPFISDMHLRTQAIRGVTFGGFAGSWKYKPRGHFLFEQPEVCDALRTFPAVDIFVAHNSPRGIHDQEDDVHFGFSAFATYIADHQPTLFLHGHQHRNVESVIGRTRVIGVYGHRILAAQDMST